MGLTKADREMLRAATQRAKARYWAARHGASCGVMVFSEGDEMTVEMKAGVWKRRDGLAVAVRHKEGQNCPWIGSDGKTRYDDGRWMRYENTDADLVEYIDVPPKPEPQPQPDAADELAALRDDRDRWTTAVQAEGRVKTLGQELATANRDWLGNRIHETEPEPQAQPDAAEELAALKDDRDKWQARAVQAEGRVKTLTQELATARQQLQDRDAADQVPGNEQLRQQVTQLIAEREGLTQQLQMMEKQAIGLTNTLADRQRKLDHAEQQRSILLGTSQDQLGQIRMAERIVSLMADKIAQLAVENA